jgi:hypothetical protein
MNPSSDEHQAKSAGMIDPRGDDKNFSLEFSWEIIEGECCGRH